MFTLLTAVLGFATSFLPTLFKYFERKQDYNYQIKLAAIKLEAIARNVDLQKEIAELQTSLGDTQSARDADSSIDGGKFINAIRDAVRPVVTFCFIGLYFGWKLMCIYVLLQAGLTTENMEIAGKIIFDAETITIIVTIMGFWFGSRAVINRSK